MHVIGLSEADYFCQIFSYHTWTKCKDGFLNRLYIFIVVIVVHFVSSTFINIIAFFYCQLCSRCSFLLRKYRESFRRILHIKNFKKVETDMAQEYFNILNLIESIEHVFSLPSLLLLMICFMQAFVSFSRFMVTSNRELTNFFLIEHLCLHVPTGIFTFLIPFYAAQVKQEMEQNKLFFNKLHDSILLNPENLANKRYLLILQALENRLPVTLTAWEMIGFTGSTLPAIL